MSKTVQLQPYDEFNRALEADVHPADWVNPEPKKEGYHLVVIGAGTAGLVTAAGAAGLGARVALVERELMGGDCLNIGCVPSKALISTARIAATAKKADEFGLALAANMDFDFAAAMKRMRKLRAQISPNDSAKRFSDLGIDVFFGQGTFTNDQSVTVTSSKGDSRDLRYKKAVIATGARASAPPIKGLDNVEFLTNENLFSLTELPKRFGIIGAGPIGVEMAQSFARFGSQVVLFEMADTILAREDPEAAAIVAKQLQADGVQIVTGSANQELHSAGEQIRVTGTSGAKPYDILVDKLLVAVGRAPNTENLGLETVGVKFDKRGIEVNDSLQTSNPKIYAAGDICSQFKFTHAADFQARIVIQNALFALGPFGKKKASDLIIPWATYSSPEIAHVGLYEKDAKEQGVEIDTFVQHFEHVDRAILEGVTEGFVKIHVGKGTDKIVGATVVAENAGDMISELTLAMKNGIGLSKISSTIHPYPTQAESIRKVGDQFNKTRLTESAKKLLGFLMRMNVGK